MHILFFTENFPPEVNAAATRVYERACYWIKWGHEVTIITSAPNFPQGKVYPGYQNKWYQVEIIDGIKVVRVKTYIAPNQGVIKRTMDFLSFMVTGFLASLKQKKPDIAIATSPQFFAAVAGYLGATFKRVPFVFELGDLWPATIGGVGAIKTDFLLHLLEKVELYLYRHSSAIVALTRSFKTDLVRRGIDPDKIAVVINGVDLSRYKPQPRSVKLARAWGIEHKFVVGYIGTHGMAHGLQNVLQAAKQLRHKSNILFLFVGDGAMRGQLMGDAEKMNLTNVKFIGPQPKERMPEVWSMCDVALVHLKDVPVFQTVIPSKIFEAMAMGLPLLLASPRGEASGIVETCSAGVHISSADPALLAQVVEKLYDDINLRQTLAKNSLQCANLFTRERQAHDMLLVLEHLVEGHRNNVPDEVR